MRILRRPLLLLALLCIAGGSLYGVALALSRKKEPTDPESRLLAVLRREGKLSAADWPFVLCIREVRGQTFHGVVLKKLDAQGDMEWVFMASTAEFRFHSEGGVLLLDLCNGTGKDSDGTKMWFGRRCLELPTPPGFEAGAGRE